MAAVGTVDSIVGQRWPRSAMGAIPPFTLPDVIAPGTGTKVTVDSKGRVIVLDTLAAADIPDISEAHVTGLVAHLADINDALDTLEADAATQYVPVTNGDPADPQIVFDDGDVVMVRGTP